MLLCKSRNEVVIANAPWLLSWPCDQAFTHNWLLPWQDSIEKGPKAVRNSISGHKPASRDSCWLGSGCTNVYPGAPVMPSTVSLNEQKGWKFSITAQSD